MDTSYDEARRCRRCKELGVIVTTKPDRRGGKIVTVQCRNGRCRWYNTNYTFDVRPDGTVPPAIKHRPKSFPAVPDLTDRIRDSVDRQLGLETNGGGEISPRR